MTLFKKIIPYALTVAMLFSPKAISSYSNAEKSDKKTKFEEKYNVSYNTENTYDLQKKSIENRAQKLIDTYIDYAVNGTKRIIENKKTMGYVSAVRHELPGAPATKSHRTLHCLYGQYTQLNRALSETGDTIRVIPNTGNAHMATASFKRHMTELYWNPEYTKTIYNGHLYSTNDEYNTALNTYVKNNINNKTGNLDSLCNIYTNQFKQTNFCATELNPGTIIIVSSGHAVMYLGQGLVKNENFVPDIDGQAIVCSYNKEHPATYLSYWNTYNSFAADIKNILIQKYEQIIKSQTKQY